MARVNNVEIAAHKHNATVPACRERRDLRKRMYGIDMQVFRHVHGLVPAFGMTVIACHNVDY